MTTKPNLTTQDHGGNDSSMALGILHLVWGLFGPMFLIGAVVLCASGSRGWFTIRDALLPLVVIAMFVCRWLEQRSGKGTTLYGDPATSKHVQYWVIIQVGLAVLGWVGANVIGNHIVG